MNQTFFRIHEEEETTDYQVLLSLWKSKWGFDSLIVKDEFLYFRVQSLISSEHEKVLVASSDRCSHGMGEASIKIDKVDESSDLASTCNLLKQKK